MTQTKQLATDCFIAFAICVLGWATMYGWTWQPYFIYDDSYITLANAVSFLTGKTPFFSPALTGSTSIAHTLMVAMLVEFTPPETALALSNSIALFAAVMGISRICRALGLSDLHTAVMTVAYACSGLTLMHAHNGLETALVFAGSAWAIHLTMTNNRIGSAAIAGILPWIRPELCLLSLYCLFAIDQRLNIKSAIHWLLIAAATTLPFLMVSYLNTHSVIPQTMAGKLAWFSEDCAETNWKLSATFSSISTYITTIGVTFIGLAGLLTSKSYKSYYLVFTILFFYACYYALFPGALGHYNLRYQYFSYTILFYGLILLTNSKSQATKAILVAVLASQLLIMNIPNSIETSQNGRRFTAQSIAPISDWINKNTPPDATILIHDAGYIGYTSKRKLIDLVGLKTPEAIKINQKINHLSCGLDRGKSIAAIAQKYSPTYAIILNEWDLTFQITDALKKSGNHLEKVFSTNRGYSLYRIEPAGRSSPAIQGEATTPSP